MHDYYIQNCINSIIYATNERKQVFGQNLAAHLSFIPGPLGKDGSVDGAIMNEHDILIAHFQSKLSASPITADEGKALHSDILRLSPKVCIYLAGVGYQDSFLRLISSRPELSFCNIHLLILSDIFKKNYKYKNAVASIPTHKGGDVDFTKFLI